MSFRLLGGRSGPPVSSSARHRGTASAEFFWIHSVHGNRTDHDVGFVTAKAKLPLYRVFGLGADDHLYLAERHDELFPDVSEQNAEMRLYLTTEI